MGWKKKPLFKSTCRVLEKKHSQSNAHSASDLWTSEQPLLPCVCVGGGGSLDQD